MLRLQEILETHNYTLQKGLLHELQGNLAYVRHDYLAAFEYYLDACKILAKYSPASFRNTFERMRTKYWDMNLGIQALVRNFIRDNTSDISEVSLLTALEDLYMDDMDSSMY